MGDKKSRQNNSEVSVKITLIMSPGQCLCSDCPVVVEWGSKRYSSYIVILSIVICCYWQWHSRGTSASVETIIALRLWRGQNKENGRALPLEAQFSLIGRRYRK